MPREGSSFRSIWQINGEPMAADAQILTHMFTLPGCCIYGPDVRLMGFSWADGDRDLTMMMVVPDSAGDAS